MAFTTKRNRSQFCFYSVTYWSSKFIPPVHSRREKQSGILKTGLVRDTCQVNHVVSAPPGFAYVVIPHTVCSFTPRSHVTPSKCFEVTGWIDIWPFSLLWPLVFGRPFVKRFALCYQTVACLSCLYVCPVLFVTLVNGAKRLDRSRWNLACR